MGCSSCGRVGHFGSYVVPGPGQTMTNTGPLMASPNTTSGMHARYQQNGQDIAVNGLGDYFGPAQTPLIPGIQNEYLALGAGVVLVLMMMK